MLYRKFGKTNEQVSILGFGCMRLPLMPGGVAANINIAESSRLIRYAIDHGVNYIDTAYPYHGTGMGSAGQSEPVVGRILRDGYRGKVKLATNLDLVANLGVILPTNAAPQNSWHAYGSAALVMGF